MPRETEIKNIPPSHEPQADVGRDESRRDSLLVEKNVGMNPDLRVRILSKSLVYLMRLMMAVLLVVIALGWLAGTEYALHKAVAQVEEMSGGKVKLGEVQGSLLGPLKIGTLSYQTDDTRYAAKVLSLDWSALSLSLAWLYGAPIQLDDLTLQQLEIVEIKPTPTVLPDTLHLPLDFSVSKIGVEKLLYKSGDAEYHVSHIELGLDYKTNSYLLTLRNLDSKWGRGRGTLEIADVPPYAVKAHISLQQGKTYQAEAEVTGKLEQLKLLANVDAMGGKARIHAGLTPLATDLLTDMTITAEGINPALQGNGLPDANLGAVLTLVNQAGAMEGSLHASNSMPGEWDKSRLPLSEIGFRFSGAPENLALNGIKLDMGRAGHFDGNGQWAGSQLQLNLVTDGFNPQAMHSKMRSMSLAGRIRVLSDPQGQQLLTDLRYQRYGLHLDALYRDEMIELREAMITSGTSRLAMQGQLDLKTVQPFNLTGALQGFNPDDFGDYPAAKLNASFTATGQLAASQLTLGFIVADSQFLHHPLTGRGRLSLSTSRLWDSDILLQLEGNRLEAKGALGLAGDSLSFQIEADKLSMLDANLAGKIHAAGNLQGSFAAIYGDIDADMAGLSWHNEYRIDKLHVAGNLEAGADGRVVVDADLQGLTTPRLQLRRINLKVHGKRSSHQLELLAKAVDWDAQGQLAGGWDDKSGWAGQVMNLVRNGRYGFALESPAKLQVAGKQIRLGDAQFKLTAAGSAVANLLLGEFAYDGGKVQTHGEFKQLSLAYLQGLAGMEIGGESDLTLGGNWNIALQDDVSGHISLWRERGDIPLSRRSKVALGISRLDLKLEAVNNNVKGRLELEGSNLGQLKVEGQSRLSRRNDAWGFAGNAPVQMNADLSIETLSWLQALIDKTGAVQVDGMLKGKVSAYGTIDQPGLDGTMVAEHMVLAMPEQGLRFTDGHFLAKLQGRMLNLTEIAMRGGTGTLKGLGSMEFNDKSPQMKLSLVADKLEVLSRPDRNLVLSGTGDASISGRDVRMAAKLKADHGEFELRKGDEPELSVDVEVLGRSAEAEKRTVSYLVRSDFDLDLGDDFKVKGMGLDAQLGGMLKLTGTPVAPMSSRGSIRVIKGFYLAYGQHLEIDRGILNFQGPLENPSLNILAMRKNQQVEAGVTVSGTADSPHVKLVSTPDVPDGEKLSWLVLGHGLDVSNTQDFSTLQAAAGVLLAGSDSVSLQQKIARAAGLEEVSIKSEGDLTKTVFMLGKQLSSRAYISYEQGLTGVGALVKINYALTKRFSVRAQAGTSPAVDLFYTFSFY